MRNSENVLNSLAGHSQDLNYKFERLYRLLFNENLFAEAYQRLSRNPGNCTKGTDGQTIDGTSIKRIREIIEQLKDESYRPCPARRIYIPKKKGKLRPLGIPSFKDKLVQEVVRMILEAIYEGHFEDCSHGFRPHRGCHTAMASLQKGGSGTRWFIEGDIKGFFDNINHDVLISILGERIQDERFLRLIRKFLKAGYLEQWEFKNSYIGTPQGGIISPILANVYLDKLDKFMLRYIETFNKGKARQRNPEYKRVASRKDKRVKKLKSEQDEQKKEILRSEIASLHREMQQLPATLDMDDNFKRMKYVRYADDFLICVIGSKADCQKTKEDIKKFLQEQLRLQLSDEKTLITNAHDVAKFLGFEVTVRSTNKTRKDYRGIPIRSLDHKVVLLLPFEAMRKKLLDYNAMRIVIRNGKEVWESTSRPYLRSNDDLEILNRYNSEIRGIYNYYCIANNVNVLNSFYSIMKVGFDESGCYCNKRLDWAWIAQTVYFTLLFRAGGRSSKELESRFGDSLERMIAVTDRHSANFALHFLNHQVCLAHILRELQYLNELDTTQQWSGEVEKLLKEAIHERNTRPNECIEKEPWVERLDALLKKNLEEFKEQFQRFKNGLIKCRDYIFNFLEDPLIPSDNNASERGIRKLKIKLKNSGTFRSDLGADAFFDLHSIIETAKKHKQTPFEAIRALFGATDSSVVPIAE